MALRLLWVGRPVARHTRLVARIALIAVVALVTAMGLAKRGRRPDLELSFLTVPESVGNDRGASSALARRRVVLLLALGAPAVTSVGSPLVARAELTPPLRKSIEKYSEKVQGGLDWFYFEMLPSLKSEDKDAANVCLARSSSGAKNAPLEDDLFFPLRQLVGDNEEADEMGWSAAVKRMYAGEDALKNAVFADEWPTSVKEWGKIRDDVAILLTGINDLADKAVFVLPSSGYDKQRREIFVQSKKQKVLDRNAMNAFTMR